MSAKQPSAGPAAIKSAERVMLVSELLTANHDGLTFGEILEKLGVPKSSLHGLLRTMVQRGHLVFDEGTRVYRLGVRYWEAGQAFVRGTDLARVAQFCLEEASQQLGETVQLAILDGLENVYIAKVEAEQRLQLVSQVGSRLPAHATGLGKVLLAYLDDEELRSRLVGAEFECFTPETISDSTELLPALAKIRERGYAIDRGEYTSGVFCVAVPVRDHTHRVVAAMSCSIPDARMTSGTELNMLEVLRAQAVGLSNALGFHDEAA